MIKPSGPMCSRCGLRPVWPEGDWCEDCKFIMQLKISRSTRADDIIETILVMICGVVVGMLIWKVPH